MRRSCLFVLVLSACQNGLGLRGVVPLDNACTQQSARICKCDGGGDGAQLCGSEDVWAACDCNLVLAAAYCSADYVPGQEAKCVAAASTCVLQSPAPGLLGIAQRVSDVAAPYASRFEVRTDASAQSVVVVVDGQRYVTTPMAGVAVFDALPLPGDGTHEVSVTCFSREGVPRSLDIARYTVDSTPPGLSLIEPAPQQHYGPSQTLQACLTTTGGDTKLTCVSVAGGPESCASQDGCIPIACPGGPPFAVVARAVDNAGNETRVTANEVSCASTTPSALISDPIAADRILAFTQLQSPKRDADDERFGAQYDVKVCTSIAQGIARLYVSSAEGVELLAATSNDFRPQSGQCPDSYGYYALFAGATLPESATTPEGELQRSTVLRAEIEDISREVGASAPVSIWVDTSIPFINGGINSYFSMCGFMSTSTTPFTATTFAVYGTTSNFNVFFQNSSVNGGLPYAPTGSSGVAIDTAVGSKTWTDVTFELGVTEITAVVTKPSGATAALENCTVTVGPSPLKVTWVSPTQASRALNIANQDPTAPSGASGWQGVLQVLVDEPSGALVDFTTTDGVVLATGVPCAPSGATACVAEANVSLADTADISLVASASSASRAGASASLTHLFIDTVAPTAVTALTSEIIDRRGGVFDVKWTASDDQGGRLQSYEVYALRDLPIGEPIPTGAERIAFNALPSLPGQPDGVRVFDRVIERNYGFAVCAKDRAGNRGACTTLQDVKAKLNLSVYPALQPLEQPWAYDGSCDFDGDGGSDVLVAGYRSRVYLYLSQRGGMPSAPTTTFIGPANNSFGVPSRCMGDIDGDGKSDIAVSSYGDGHGRIFIFRGRSVWPATLGVSDADSVVEIDADADPGFSVAYIGADMAPIGDFDQDGANDFAITVGQYNFDASRGWAQEYVLVYRGLSSPGVLPSRVLSPRDEGSRLIRILGEPQPDSHYFGYGLFGLGNFYPGAGTTFTACGWSGRASPGRAYAVTGGASVPFQQSVYDHERLDTPCMGSSSLGTVFGRPVPVRVGTQITPTSHWQYLVDVNFTDAQQGAFQGRKVRLVNDVFVDQGYVNGVGAFSNRPAGVSVFGGAEPDYMVSMQPNAGIGRVPLYGWRATTISALASGVEHPISSTADFVYDVPLPWAQIGVNTFVGDMNGDGYAEIAISELVDYGDAAVDGSWAILW